MYGLPQVWTQWSEFNWVIYFILLNLKNLQGNKQTNLTFIKSIFKKKGLKQISWYISLSMSGYSPFLVCKLIAPNIFRYCRRKKCLILE